MTEIKEFSWKVFENTREWIKYADAKAAILISANGIILTLAIGRFKEITEIVKRYPVLFTILFVAAGLFLVLSFIKSIQCLQPILKIKGPKGNSLIYFGDISANYTAAKDYVKEINEKMSSNEPERYSNIQNEISNQVWALSNVATAKYAQIRAAIVFFLLLFSVGIMIFVSALLLK
jgi:hypothetical protein